MPVNLHELPVFREALAYLYAEHARIEQHELAVAIHDKQGITPVPVAGLAMLMLGPGTSITHAAVKTLADNNCLVCWCGEENMRFYAWGTGGTRSAAPLLRQAQLAMHPDLRLKVVKKMYRMRFEDELSDDLTIEQLRGMEGARVRSAYALISHQTGAIWEGRSYDRGTWVAADPVNRALSAANSCLYGVCQAAILSMGYSPAIGFIHTGKQLSFVYDIADLYKTEVTIPVAFTVAAEDEKFVEQRVRVRLRERFQQIQLLTHIVSDLHALFGTKPAQPEFPADEDPAVPAPLWSPGGRGEEG
jgi:CRISPR-associated protein Cas1